jgi:hypothetical protein
MKTLLLLSLLLSNPVFAAEGKVKKAAPAGLLFDEIVCADAVVNKELPKTPPDQSAIRAFTLAYAMDMNGMKKTLEVITGEKLLEDGIAIDDRKDVFAKKLVRDVLVEKLQAIGLEPKFEMVADKGVNVVAEIRGKKSPKEVIEVVTHYDSTGYNGADDNGSGVAFNLELARVAKMAQFDRTIRFVFTDLEEDERQGSKGHLQLQQGSSDKIVTAIVVDTIAWGDKKRPRQLAVVEVGTAAMFQGNGFQPQKDLALQIAYLLARFPAPGTVDFSIETEDSEPKTADHGIYWKGGIPAVLIGEANEDGLLNPGYHGKDDNLKGINWDYYTSVTRQAAGIIFSLAGAEYDLGNKGAVELEKQVAGIEQLHVLPFAAIPDSLDWGDYEPPRSSSSYSSSGYSNSDLETVKKALKKANPDKFLVGLMPDDTNSDHARVFAIDKEEGRHWEMTSLSRKSQAMPLLEAAANAGATIVDVAESKSGMIYTLDASRLFYDYFWEDQEKLKDKIGYTVRDRKPPGPKTELSAGAKAFMDSVGLTKYEGEESLVIAVVNKTEGRPKLSPFFVFDPKLKKSISRRNLLSFGDVEAMAKWLKEKNILIDFIFVDEAALEKAGDDIAVLGYDFAGKFGKDGDALINAGVVFVKIDLDAKDEEK